MTTALGHFHARELIHRDLRPANVLVDPTTGDAWLTGFGVAMRLPGDGPASGSVEGGGGNVALYVARTDAKDQSFRLTRGVISIL